MSRVSALGTPDVKFVRDVLRQFIHNGDAINKTDLTELGHSSLIKRAKDGHRHARGVLLGLSKDGLRSHAEAVLSEETCTITTAAGKKIAIPARMAVRPTGEDGKPGRWINRTFWDWSWVEFTDGLNYRISRRDGESTVIEGLQEILKLRTLCPASATPAEACATLGIDMQAFHIAL